MKNPLALLLGLACLTALSIGPARAAVPSETTSFEPNAGNWIPGTGTWIIETTETTTKLVHETAVPKNYRVTNTSGAGAGENVMVQKKTEKGEWEDVAELSNNESVDVGLRVGDSLRVEKVGSGDRDGTYEEV